MNTVLKLLSLSLVALTLTSLALGQPASATQAKVGSILCAYWRDIPGATVDDLTSLPAYPNFPHEQVELDHFEIPENQPGEFATVIRGFIHPPQDGTYTFYIASTNEGQLWLGEAGSVAEVAKSLVAHIPQWCAPRDWAACKQQPIELKQGVPYYIEARHKNGGGDNHLAVAWKLPDGTLEAPIPGSRLSPAKTMMVAPPKTAFDVLPTQPGQHRLNVAVDYLMQRFTVPINITLPEAYKPRQSNPAIIYIADPDAPLDLPAIMPADWRSSHNVILITPELPDGRQYQQRVTTAGIAAALRSVCNGLQVDRKHLGLTGDGAGGTAAWRLALELPSYFSAFSPINAHEVDDPRLKQSLAGTQVRIYTDVNEGFATGRANSMFAALETNDPKPEIIYLGEKELAANPAPQYCYASRDFHTKLLSLQPPTQPAASPNIIRRLIVSISVAVVFFAYLLYRLKHPKPHKPTRR